MLHCAVLCCAAVIVAKTKFSMCVEEIDAALEQLGNVKKVGGS